MKIKYNGESLKAKNYNVPELEWYPGEIKEVEDTKAKELLKNSMFIEIKEKNKKESE